MLHIPNLLVGILRDADMSTTAFQFILSASQNHALQYVNTILSDMEPFFNDATDADLDDMEGNNVGISYFYY